MECKQETNSAQCNCSYPGCANHGICCQCIANHRRHGELPACYFSPEVERTYDRSIDRFIRAQKR
jgi:hypothetical protein